MNLFDYVGIAAVIAAFGLVLAVGDCNPTFADCAQVCGGPDRIARVEINSNTAVCECRTSGRPQ